MAEEETRNSPPAGGREGEEEKFHLRRSGGPGSPAGGGERFAPPPSSDSPPAGAPPRASQTPEFTERAAEEHLPAEERDRILRELSTSGERREESRKVRVDRLYNLELVIHTVSGNKFTAYLSFKDDVERGRLTEEEARTMLEKVENDLKNRTFQRPISYSEPGKEGASSEHVFNPACVECITITRRE